MLEYTKKILEKVSFDVKLFRKELSKAYNYLVEEEIKELKKWVKMRFANELPLEKILVEA